MGLRVRELVSRKKCFDDKCGFPSIRNNVSTPFRCKLDEKIDNLFWLEIFQYLEI